MRLSGRKIILGVTGSIAAYKAVYLLRRLVEQGADVTVVMTREAARFMTPLTFQVLSGKRVYTDMFDSAQDGEMAHLYLGRDADVVLVAPATANIIGKMSSGISDDLLSTILVACKCPVLMAPAMDPEMYENSVVQKNISHLRQSDVEFIGPVTGALASGVEGVGRMTEPEDILTYVEDKLTANRDMKGHVVLVTAGPTREAIDPVRYIGNISSGKMGYAIADAARRRGARVILISGPTSLSPPHGVECVNIVTAQEMLNSVIDRLPDATMVIMAAAVSDFRPDSVAGSKIKKDTTLISQRLPKEHEMPSPPGGVGKSEGESSDDTHKSKGAAKEEGQSSRRLQPAPLSGENIVLKLVKTTDILEEVSRKKGKQFIVGFAAETEDLIKNAKEKLESKRLDMIVANDVGLPGAGFGEDTNIVTLIDRWGKIIEWPLMSKDDIADKILGHVLERLKGQYHG